MCNNSACKNAHVKVIRREVVHKLFFVCLKLFKLLMVKRLKNRTCVKTGFSDSAEVINVLKLDVFGQFYRPSTCK